MLKNRKLIINLHKQLFEITGKMINLVSRHNDFTAEEFGHTDTDFSEPAETHYEKVSTNEILAICKDLMFKCQYMIVHEKVLDFTTDDDFDKITFVLKIANDIIGFKLFSPRRLIKYFCISSIRFGHAVDTVENVYDSLLN